MTTGWLVQAFGAVLVLLVLQDVFTTVLFPASGHGLLRRPLSRVVDSAFRAVGRRLDGPPRRKLLAYSGPVQISVNMTAWILLLTAGWALLFQPALGFQITSAQGPTDRSLATALYYSGYALTTLGTGDVVAHNALYRLLTVTEAAIGFATVSMAITYFLSVYSALTQRKVAAALLHHRTYGTGQPAALVAGLVRDGELPGLIDELDTLARALQHALETHASYPVLRYFHQRHVYYALPRVLLLGLDTVTLLRAVLDPDRYRSVLCSPAIAGLSAAAEDLLSELLPDAARGATAAPPWPRWRRHVEHAAGQLATAGLEVRRNADAVAGDYLRLRMQWDFRLRRLADAMVYDWDAIEPDEPCIPGLPEEPMSPQRVSPPNSRPSPSNGRLRLRPRRSLRQRGR